MSESIVIDVISDVVCPWCFIGMKRLETAITLTDGVDVQMRWRPYQLDPNIPKEGLPRRQYMLDKFGSEDRLKQIHDQIVALGEVEGIRFNFDAMQTAANTLDAHRLIRWAGSPKSPAGAQSLVVRLLFEANFEQGRDIGDHAVLIEIAEEAGMDTALVSVLLSSPSDVESVRNEIATAGQMGVNGVPCFLIEGKYAVMGAQDPEVLSDAIKQVATAKARGELESNEPQA
jgi:predicted DsbA family dithiol-disulfide isomerase